MPNFQPLGNRLLVLMDEAGETQTKSGLFIPAQAQEKPQVGTVVAVGPGKVHAFDPSAHPNENPYGRLVPPGVKEGDRVVVGKYTGSHLTLDGTTYVVLDADEVLGVLT